MAVQDAYAGGNGIFKRGEKPAPDLKSGTHVGTITEIDTRYNDDGACYHIFKGHIDHHGTRVRVSAIAGDDTKPTRKLVRWMLALDGKTPEDVDDSLDLSTLPTQGRALFSIAYTTRKRQPDGKYAEVATEFPQLADILPMPENMTDVPF